MMQSRSCPTWLRGILAASVFLVWVAHGTAPRADVSVSINPAWVCAEHQEVFRAFLWVDVAGSEFDGYETTIQFDPDYLTFVAVHQEPLMTDPPGSTWWHTEVTDSTVFISHVLLSGGIGITGPGALSSIDFRATAATGETPIRFGDTFFFRVGEYVPNVTHDGLAYITDDCTMAACCLESGDCLLLGSDDCATAGGIWHSTWPACDPNPCPPPSGACCRATGLCEFLTALDCGAVGGSWLGYGTGCDPNPCPQPGACCTGEDCALTFSYEACSDLGGAWFPTLTTCDPNPCTWAGLTTALPPHGPCLFAPRPNPTRGSTLLLYFLAAPGDVDLEVFDAGGRCVAQVYRGAQAQGFGAVEWSARDVAGTPVPLGTYFCRLTVGGQAWTQRVMVLR
jgi:hypothetical protein